MKNFNEIIEMRKEIEIQRIRNDIDNENIFIMNNSQYERFLDYLNENFENEFEMMDNKKDKNLKLFIDKSNKDNQIQILIQYQIHEMRDKDIKIDSRKRESDNHSFKIIYHRNKDNSLEYRIFESYRDSENKLKRIRIRNNEIKKIEKNKDKMIKYFESLFKEEKKEKKII